MTKIYTKCKLEKSIDEFYIDKRMNDGHRSRCKYCVNESSLKYNSENRSKINAIDKKYRQNNKETIQKYRDKNKDKRNTNSRDKYLNDPFFKLRICLSCQVNKALKKLKSNKGGLSVLKFLPYSSAVLKLHLEKQFEPWMNWSNWGVYDQNIWDDNNTSTWTWQLDHIIPQSNLLYSSMEDDNFKKCWALENLRPYSAKQNILDGANRTRHL